ncbi:MAG: sigma-70 family RNA polymerase sigma factor [Proteobacteria bacterium]|nr:sigma-70 family RNA polymerase sigma factor [Pseudomonadota bacterium]
MSQQNDEQLMLAFASSDHRAFEVLYQRHKGSLYRYFLKSCNTQSVAQELFQELWLKIIKHKSKYSTDYKFTTWAYRMARNQLIDWYRKNHNTNTLFDSNENDIEAVDLTLPEPENEFERKKIAKSLKFEIGKLPFRQREVFLLHHDAGFTMQQIAEIIESNKEAVKSQYRYAISKLRLALEKLR